MAHFAEVNKGVVVRVVVVPDDQESRGNAFLSKDLGLGGVWVQTSYNANIRNKFAGQGDLYLKDEDIFMSPKPYESWILGHSEEVGYEWVAPVDYPSEGQHSWDEDTQSWVAIDGE